MTDCISIEELNKVLVKYFGEVINEMDYMSLTDIYSKWLTFELPAVGQVLFFEESVMKLNGSKGTG